MRTVSIIPMFGFGDTIAIYPYITKLCEEYDRVEIATYYWRLFHHLPNVDFLHPDWLGVRSYPSGEAAWGQGPDREIPHFTEEPKSWFTHQYLAGDSHIESFETRTGLVMTAEEYDRRFWYPYQLRPPYLLPSEYLLVHAPSYKKGDQAIERVPDMDIFVSTLIWVRDMTNLPLVWLMDTNTDDNLTPHFPSAYVINGLNDFETDTIALCQNAAGVVTYPCFLFWAALMARAPLLTVFGGGRVDSLEWQCGEKVPVDNLFPLIPDNYCYCEGSNKYEDWRSRMERHTCDKNISSYRIQNTLRAFSTTLNDGRRRGNWQDQQTQP